MNFVAHVWETDPILGHLTYGLQDDFTT